MSIGAAGFLQRLRGLRRASARRLRAAARQRAGVPRRPACPAGRAARTRPGNTPACALSRKPISSRCRLVTRRRRCWLGCRCSTPARSSSSTARFRADLSACRRGFARFARAAGLRHPDLAGPGTDGRAEHHARRGRRRDRRACRRRRRHRDAGQHRRRGTGLPSAPRIRLARGARLTLIEISIGEGAYLEQSGGRSSCRRGRASDPLRLQDEVARRLPRLHASTPRSPPAAPMTASLLNLGAHLARTEVHARLGGDRRDRASERGANAGRLAARRLHHRRAARRAARHVAPDGEERAGRPCRAACSRARSRSLAMRRRPTAIR